MRWKAEYVVAAALAVALALPVGIIVAAQVVSRQLQQTDYWVLHSGEVELNLAEVQLGVDQAAGAARRYAALGGEANRAAYAALRSGPAGRLAQLRRETLDNPVQQPALDRLEAAATAELRLLDRAVALRQEGAAPALAVLNGPEAFAGRDAVQSAARAAESEESRVLAARRKQLQTLSQHWRTGFYASLGLSLLLILGGFGLLVLEVRRRRMAEEALTGERHRLDISLQRFERMTDNVPAVVWVAREDGGLEFVSDGVREAFGRDAEQAREAAGRELAGWFEGDHAAAVGRALRRLFADGTEMGLDAQLREGGAWRWVHVSARRVRRPEGEIVADGLMVDQTERLRTMEADVNLRAAEESNRFRTQFLSTLSHELRTPLTAILGFSDLLIREVDGRVPEATAALAEQIRCAGRNLLALTNDVLDWGKLEAGQLRLDPAALPLEWPLTEVTDLLAPLLAIKSLRMERRLEADAPVLADRARVRQILLNLLGNAIKYSPPGATIEVVSRRDAGLVQVEIVDHGIGIPEAEQRIIFERYRQGSAAAAVGGTGLGLALVKQLVELHGGAVWVKSAPGAGATFGFSLPLAEVGETAVAV